MCTCRKQGYSRNTRRHRDNLPQPGVDIGDICRMLEPFPIRVVLCFVLWLASRRREVRVVIIHYPALALRQEDSTVPHDRFASGTPK